MVGSHQEFVRRFAEGIGKLTGNMKGDHREEDRRTCHKNAGGCRIMRDGDQQLLTGKPPRWWVNRPYHRIRVATSG
ncbi:hypothetical protein BHE74_00037602 [Ensete ventricosum]|nr:hypothetical protein BHE74_00037602 [Ensete ventricosum]